MDAGNFSELLSVLSSSTQSRTAASIRLGRVLSVSPLTIDVGGTTQESYRFYACSRQWQVGDLAMMLTEDDQTFYLIDKVVHL